LPRGRSFSRHGNDREHICSILSASFAQYQPRSQSIQGPPLTRYPGLGWDRPPGAPTPKLHAPADRRSGSGSRDHIPANLGYPLWRARRANRPPKHRREAAGSNNFGSDGSDHGAQLTATGSKGSATIVDCITIDYDLPRGGDRELSEVSADQSLEPVSFVPPQDRCVAAARSALALKTEAPPRGLVRYYSRASICGRSVGSSAT